MTTIGVDGGKKERTAKKSSLAVIYITERCCGVPKIPIGQISQKSFGTLI